MQLERRLSVAIVGLVYFSLQCSSVLAATGECSDVDRLLTTTPAPPTTVGTWKFYLDETKYAVRRDVDLVLVGDSIAQAWDTKMFLPRQVVNLGVGADKTQHVLWRLKFKKWSILRPKNVLVLLGTNNLSALDKPCAIYAGLAKVLKKVGSIWPSAKIGFLEILPRGPQFLEFNALRVEVNNDVRRISGVKTINVDDEITCGWKEGCPNYAADTLHLTENGYHVLLKRLLAGFLNRG
jgi:lysophospholipase L1-like esterase